MLLTDATLKLHDGKTETAVTFTAGQIALVVSNPTGSSQSFSVRVEGKSFTTSLDPGSVGTYVW